MQKQGYTPKTVCKFMVFFGIQYQTVYVKCRTTEAGEKTIREHMAHAKTVQFIEAGDGFGFDFEAND